MPCKNEVYNRIRHPDITGLHHVSYYLIAIVWSHVMCDTHTQKLYYPGHSSVDCPSQRFLRGNFSDVLVLLFDFQRLIKNPRNHSAVRYNSSGQQWTKHESFGVLSRLCLLLPPSLITVLSGGVCLLYTSRCV